MIPIRLELENFLCYRDPGPLDLTGIQVACLTGENGAGKSSLLDAITWALWGQARTRRDDDLVHQGQDGMQVQFDFGLGKNTYRVVRKRSSRGRGQSLLDLQIEHGDSFRSISESTIRGTQEKINQILRLDYRTFVNSAFLVQGRADEFTVQTPSERKAILAEILGLDIWETYEERAKDRIRANDQEAASLTAQVVEIERELAREAEYKDALISAQGEARQTTDRLRAAEQVVREIDASREAMRLNKNQLGDLEQRLAQVERRLKQIRTEMAAQQALVAEYESVLTSSDEIRAGYQHWLAARAAEEELSAALSRHAKLTERRAELEGIIKVARAELDGQQIALRDRCAELEQTAAKGQLTADLDQTRDEVEALLGVQEERESARDHLGKLDQEAAELRARNDSLRTEMDDVKEKIEMLSVEMGASCPLCRQPLTESHRQELLAQFEAEGTERGDTFRSNRSRLEEIDAASGKLREELEQIARRLSPLAALQRKEATLVQKLEAAGEAASALESQRAELAEVTIRLDNKAFAVEARTELSQLQAEIATLGYEPAKHDRIRNEVRGYAPFEERHAKLLAASSQMEGARGTLRNLMAQEAELRTLASEDQDKAISVSAEIARLDRQLIGATAKELELAELRQAKVMADNRVGAAQQRLTALDSLQERKRTLTSRQRDLAQETAIYQELRAAFGKKGVPAMIIEAIIPEIEEIANRLLAQMTDGRMHVRFETQREKVTGGVAETLDIRISDELGTRNYELYSGGESFRVNLSIRIALSKLLAGRAGAQLRTLFIDEGFGTQDARGRERLVEAINSIQDDFDRILVITHIPELRDAFPVRIEVTKGPDGSQIELN